MEPLPASVVGVFPFIAAGDLSVGPLIAVILTGWLVSLGLVVSKRRVGLMLAAALGLAVSIYLGLQHAADAGTSVCSVSEVFNCDTVNRSKYSELMGVPIAFLGAGFYAAVLAVAGGLLRKPEGYSRAGHAIFAGSLVGVAYSVFLAWASMQVGAWCLFCISLYGLNGILLFGGAQEARASGTGALMAGIAPALMGKQDRSIGVMVPVGLVTVFVTNAMFGGGHGEPSSTVTAADAASGEVRSEDLAQLFQSPKQPLVLDGTEPVFGDPSAPYVLVEFADYECPHCAATTPTLKALVEQHPEIQLQFKHYPISNVCNDAIGAAGHVNACSAAAAAECARQQGKFWELSDLMFKNQQYLTKEDLRFMAGQTALDMEAFEACMANPATEQAVRVDAASGEAAGLSGTPSLYLAGVTSDGFVQVKGLAEEAAALVAAHKLGVAMPPTPPYAAARH